MSVIGLTLVLTAMLMRLSSVQARVDKTTSRGTEGVVSHSGAYSTQNSAQPIGALVTGPMPIYGACSCARLAVAEANSATPNAIRMTHAVTPRLAPVTQFIVTPSLIVGATFRTKFLRRR